MLCKVYIVLYWYPSLHYCRLHSTCPLTPTDWYTSSTQPPPKRYCTSITMLPKHTHGLINITLLICTWPLLNQLWSTTSYQNIHMVSLLWYAWWPPVVDLFFSLSSVGVHFAQEVLRNWQSKEVLIVRGIWQWLWVHVLCLPYICGQVNPPNLHTLQCIASLLVLITM